MSEEDKPPKKPPKKRGPKGGIKHQPGKGHDRKSAGAKKKRFAKKASKKKQQQTDDARKAWEEWDKLPDEVRRLLGPSTMPTVEAGR